MRQDTAERRPRPRWRLRRAAQLYTGRNGGRPVVRPPVSSTPALWLFAMSIGVDVTRSAVGRLTIIAKAQLVRIVFTLRTMYTIPVNIFDVADREQY
ncbi:hypothetical protein EVAR_52045_1 [Eumeta japonica]|uniref:Uncharacterized protein n=1 Tax=Eumeta variegata TaxID=151549 RepID=A0A4C1Z809_EUMVA|nr:hypothetical protein EVAR_52045_1 [Eumeta japonica]